MPGPLFNLSAFLGALFAVKFGYFPPLGSAVAWLGLFGPGVALMFAAMPFWKSLRSLQIYKNALPGEQQLGGCTVFGPVDHRGAESVGVERGL